MRKLIAAMKISIDGKIEGPEGYADWVESWADEYGLTSRIDACVLGGRMYPNYELYWTSVQNESDKPETLGSGQATPAEVEWARFAARTPHYVLSSTLTTAQWPKTSFLRSLDDLAALKQEPGQDIYLMGGAQITADCIEAGLVDELRLIVYPLITGPGLPLFTEPTRRRLELSEVQQLSDGRVGLVYTLGSN
ncbi:dihydrofolate reductase family protein [Kribbella sp. NPDC056861]|uniref:dihydrofolate reductase family protein n=1 Tax=Kribbella sp. NPDC056861 TaxID=3154857 RepID=UPI003418E25D